MRKLLFATVGLLAVGAAAAAQAQTSPETAIDPETVVARVDGVDIKASAVAKAYAELPQEYRQLPINVLFPQLLDQLINRQLMLKAGLEQKLDEDAGIRAEVREFEDFAIQRAYLEGYIDKVVTEDAVRTEYETTVGAQEGKQQVKASHILLQSEEDAQAVIEELADGAEFAQLARDKSTGPSAPKGGDLGFFNREQMVAPFAEAAFELEEGETTTAPVKTRFGWHVIMVTGRRTLPPPPFEEVRDQIHDRLTRDALEEHMAQLRETTTVEKFNPDGSPVK